MREINFFTRAQNHFREKRPPPHTEGRHFVIAWNNWDDFDYKCLFSLHYFDDDGDWLRIGDVKVLHETAKRTTLPSRFSTSTPLDDSYCSLGQSPEYYDRLITTFGRDDAAEILLSLRDIVISDVAREKFRSHDGYSTSLTRESEALGALRRCPTNFGLLPDGEGEKEDFAFIAKLDGFDESHVINLEFPLTGGLPHQLSVLVGKNGTGKSGILAKLANVMSGARPNDGDFLPHRPNFLRTICVSYSPFQVFAPPRIASKSYVYCGLPSADSPVGSVVESWADAFEEVTKQDQLPLWVSIVGARDLLGLAANLVKTRQDFLTLIQQGSSGQRLVISILTQLLAEIRPRCLVLFDEPEAYLHPTLLSTLLRQLVDLLRKKESHCIIATHSAVVVQEVPAQFVRVLRRVDNTPSVGELDVECFGANLSRIVDEVFEINEDDRNYQTYLLEMVHREGTVDDVLRLFAMGLPLNARIFLKTRAGEVDVEA